MKYLDNIDIKGNLNTERLKLPNSTVHNIVGQPSVYNIDVLSNYTHDINIIDNVNNITLNPINGNLLQPFYVLNIKTNNTNNTIIKLNGSGYIFGESDLYVNKDVSALLYIKMIKPNHFVIVDGLYDLASNLVQSETYTVSNISIDSNTPTPPSGIYKLSFANVDKKLIIHNGVQEFTSGLEFSDLEENKEYRVSINEPSSGNGVNDGRNFPFMGSFVVDYSPTITQVFVLKTGHANSFRFMKVFGQNTIYISHFQQTKINITN